MVCFPKVYGSSIRGCIRPSRTRADPYLRERIHRICLELTMTRSSMRSIGTGPRLYRLRLANRYSEQSKGILLNTITVYMNEIRTQFFFGCTDTLSTHCHSTEKINKLRFRRFGISKFTITYIGSTTTSLYRILALTNIILAIYGIIYLYENSVV